MMKMYRELKPGKMHLLDLVANANERLKILNLLREPDLNWNNCADLLENLENKLVMNFPFAFRSYYEGSDEELFVQVDTMSRNALKYYCCRDANLTNWFIESEIDLFKKFLISLELRELHKFIEVNEPTFSIISDNEKQEKLLQLIVLTNGLKDIESTIFYKIPENKAANLVHDKLVYSCGGYAFVPNYHLIHVITEIYKSELHNNVQLVKQNLGCDIPLMDEFCAKFDWSFIFERSFFNNNNTSLQLLQNAENINCDNIWKAPGLWFPLCMRMLMMHLEDPYPLEVSAFIVLRRFFKDMGFTVKESIFFWRQHFARQLSSKAFKDQHVNSIKSDYGLVGKREECRSYACKDVIELQSEVGSCCGCPFQMSSKEVLNEIFEDSGFNVPDIEDLNYYIQNKKYQKACSKYLSVLHKLPVEQEEMHSPIQYFKRSSAFSLSNREAYYVNVSRSVDHILWRPLNITIRQPSATLVAYNYFGSEKYAAQYFSYFKIRKKKTYHHFPAQLG